MIKKKSYWILMLTAICILVVTGCKKEGKTADFHIYYTDSEGVSLVEKDIKPEGKTQKEQIDEILDKLEPHFPQYARIHRTTYFRWREQAFGAVGSILWGYEGESERILKLVCEDYEEK